MRKGLPQPRQVGSPMQNRGPQRPNDYYDGYSRNAPPRSPMMRNGNGYESSRYVGGSGGGRQQPPEQYSRSARLDNAPTPQLRYTDDRRGAGPRQERPERRYPLRTAQDDDASSQSRSYDIDRSRSEYGRERARSRGRLDPRAATEPRDRGRYDRDYGSREREPANNLRSNSRARENEAARRPRRDASRGRQEYANSPALGSPSLGHSRSQGPNDRYRGRPARTTSENRSRQDSDASSRSSSRTDERSVRSTASSNLSDLFGQIESDIDATLSETFSSKDPNSAKYASSSRDNMDRREREAREKREKEARERREKEREAREREAREREAREKEAREKEAREREAREREAREREAKEREAKEREAREREAREREAREREREKERQERLRNMNNNDDFDLPKPQRVGVSTPDLPRPARNQSNNIDRTPSRPPRQESVDAVASNNSSPLSPRLDIGRSASSVGNLSRSASSARNVGPHRGRVPPPIPMPVPDMPSDIADVTQNDQDVDTLVSYLFIYNLIILFKQ